MKNQIIFASNNKKKLEEIQAMLPENIILKSLNEIKCYDEIPETSDTLEGNALQKAQYIFDRFHENCFADDTGLEVEALNGRPGVYSARYAGEACSPEANMQKLLMEMKGLENRKARFRTVIAAIIAGKSYFFEGAVNGEITLEKSGNHGFGYDPVFIPEGFNRTFAEMTMDEKNAISHRGRALKSFMEGLEKLLDKS